MNAFVCARCGFLAFNAAPDNCPVCGAPKEQFKNDPGAIKKPADPTNLSELEKKHIPLIKINRQCGLAEGGCADADIRVGEILHVMEPKHYIMYVDIYLDYNFIARYHLTPEKLHPGLRIHAKGTGRLGVLENCNIHGRWFAETEI